MTPRTDVSEYLEVKAADIELLMSFKKVYCGKLK